jgi:hypothetical protein
MASRTWYAAIAAVGALFTAACGGGGGGGDALRTCSTPGGQLTLGEYQVGNNTYVNEQLEPPERRIPHSAYSQCAEAEAGEGGTINAGWTWDWPHVEGDVTVRATPGVIYGFNPWDPASTTPNLPRMISEIGALTVDAASVEQVVGEDSISRVAVIVWLTDSATKDPGDAALDIMGSISIFMNDYPARSYGGTSVTIGGVDYVVTVYGSAVNYWRSPGIDTPITSLHIDVQDFLADAVDRGAIQDSWFAADVSTGPIVEEGAGELRLVGYEVEVVPVALE